MCLHLPTQCLYTSRHVIFDENVYPFKQEAANTPNISSISENEFIWGPILQLVSKDSIHASRPQEDTSPASSPSTEVQEPAIPVSNQVPPENLPLSLPQPTRTIITKSMNNIFRPKQIHHTSKHPIPESQEPTCVSQALKDPNWRKAMSDEVTALLNHGTWELVPPAQEQNLVGCKFVFWIKRNPDGTINRYKSQTCCQRLSSNTWD